MESIWSGHFVVPMKKGERKVKLVRIALTFKGLF